MGHYGEMGSEAQLLTASFMPPLIFAIIVFEKKNLKFCFEIICFVSMKCVIILSNMLIIMVQCFVGYLFDVKHSALQGYSPTSVTFSFAIFVRFFLFFFSNDMSP